MFATLQWWCSAQGIAWTWQWRPYPGVWLLVLAFAVPYAWALWRERRRGRGSIELARPASFAGGLALLWIALDWPVGTLGAGYLASVHMIQFLVIVMLAPPLLLCGLAGGALAWVERSRFLRPIARRIAHPVAALVIYSAVVITTHVPAVVDTLMATQLGSLALDMAWLAGGLIFWWPIVPGAAVRPALAPPLKLGYLFIALLPDKGVGTYLLYSHLPVYRTYELAPPVGHITSRLDQGLAGGFMMLGGMLIMGLAITIIFFRWSAREDDGGSAYEPPPRWRPVRPPPVRPAPRRPVAAGWSDAGR